MKVRAWSLAVLLPWGAQDSSAPSLGSFAAALDQYRRGEYEAAFEGFQAILERAGPAVRPEVRLNAGLCALRLLRSRDAEELVAPLSDVEGRRADAAFVLALAARQHGERAVVAAKLPDAEPMAWVMATRAMQQSEAQFRAAVRLRPDWGEAVRNLERTLLRRAEVEAERASAKPKEAKQEDAPQPEPVVEPPRSASPPEVVIPEVMQEALSASELLQLQELVRSQQRQKVRGRQERSRGNAKLGGRDW